MATERPSISPVKELDLRSINNALNEVRQQFIVLNQQLQLVNLKAGQNALNASQGSGNVVALQQQVAALTALVGTLAAGSLAPTATYRSDRAVQTNDPVYATSDGGVSPVDTQDPTAIFAVLGLATSNAAIGANVVVRRSGPMAVTGASFEVGRAVYAQAGSGLTQYPNYAAVAIPVGVATATNAMDVRCAWPALLETPLYSGGYEQFMPVALALVENVLSFVTSVFGQPDGILVKVGGQLVTREIVTPSGSGLNVLDGDGVFGNPSIQ